jgi:hypothetical protein
MDGRFNTESQWMPTSLEESPDGHGSVPGVTLQVDDPCFHRGREEIEAVIESKDAVVSPSL